MFRWELATYQDISKNFTKEVLESIISTLKFANRRGHKIASTLHLFKILLEQQNLRPYFEKIGINKMQIDARIQDFLKNITYPIIVHPGKVVFTPDLRATLLRSSLITRQAGGGEVGIVELFFSSLFDPQVSQILQQSGVDISSLKESLKWEEEKATHAKGGPKPFVSLFSIDLVGQARAGKLEEIIDREMELARLIRILTRSNKNNCLLLGGAGVGRSSIVNQLAQKIASGDIPSRLKDTKIFKLNIAEIVSALTERVPADFASSLRTEFEKYQNPIIFIPNLEVLFSGSNIEGSVILFLLENLISSDEIRFICTQTSEAYRKFFSQDQTFTERFEIVKVAEPSVDLSIKILKQVAKKLSNFHKIQIKEDTILATVLLSKRYLNEKFLPSCAIEVLDEASLRVALEGGVDLRKEDICGVISEKTGIPLEQLTISEQKKLADLEILLNKSVIGQEEAVRIVSEVAKRGSVGLKDAKRPIGSFLFLGPSGVGKTFLAKNLTKLIYDNENAMIKLDMNGFDESQLTNSAWERPSCLIFLDEIEKAHPKAFDTFLKLLDEGRLTDGQGRSVDFKNTIIIATSNIASSEIAEKVVSNKKKLIGSEREDFCTAKVMPILKQHFRPEFINRFDEVVIFDPLQVDDLVMIARSRIEEVEKRFKDKNITIFVSEQRLLDLAEKTYDTSFGARQLNQIIQDQIENVIARKIISGEVKEGDAVNF